MQKEHELFGNGSFSTKGKKFLLESYTSKGEGGEKVYKYGKKRNIHYVWYECRGWTYLWGLNISSEDLTNKMIDKFNRDGWKINTFYRHDGYIPNLPLVLWFMILFTQCITLGFITYFWGHYIIVEKSFNSYEEGEDSKKELMEEFRKERRMMYGHAVLMFVLFSIVLYFSASIISNTSLIQLLSLSGF